MKKVYILLATCFVLSALALTTYFYIRILAPNIAFLANNLSNKKTSVLLYKKVTPNIWPWFGLNFEGVKFYDKYSDLSWEAPKLELELSLKHAILYDHKISKVRIYNSKIHLNKKLFDWYKEISNGNLSSNIGLPELALDKSISFEVINGDLESLELQLKRLNIQASGIKFASPFTLNVRGFWRQHPFDASSLITNKSKAMYFENSHLSIFEISKNYGVSNLRINSDIIYNKNDKLLTMNNFVVMTPEIRLQGKIAVNTDQKLLSHGYIGLPASPCRKILDDLNYKLSNEVDFLDRCSANIDWEKNILRFNVSTTSFTSNGIINLSNPDDPKNTINISGGNINTIKSINNNPESVAKILNKWFHELSWVNTYYNLLPIKQANCINYGVNNRCKIDIDSGSLEATLNGIDSGKLILKELSTDQVLKLANIASQENINGQVSGEYNWRLDSGIMTYNGIINIANLRSNFWDLQGALLSPELSQNLIQQPKAENIWHKVSVVFQGLNDIFNIDNMTLNSDKITTKASGIIDFGSGIFSILGKNSGKHFNLIGKWPNIIRVLVSQSSPGRI